MDEVHKRALNQCRPKIVSDLSIENEFLDQLSKQEIFTSMILEDIQEMPSRSKKVREMLLILVRRGPTAYARFLDCLDNSGHQHLASIIRETENEIRNSNAHHPTDSSKHEDILLHPSASADPLSQHNRPNQFCTSHSLPNITLSSSDNRVTSTSNESASNHDNTSLSAEDNTTDGVIMENDTDESNKQ